MNKKLTSLILAGCICLSGAYSGTLCERPAHALQIIASVTKITIKKDVIAIGEKVQLELEWSTGAKQELFYKSSDEGILTVDSNGVVTGISDGTATVTVSHSNMGTDKTIEITVSSDVEISITYNTSELELGTKLKKYDTLHYDGKSKGYAANIINTKGNYDLAYINIADYVLPFDAEIVGIDGLYIYIAPQIDGITYLDGRTLSVGDTIDRNTHLLCYDYHINRMVLPVFLPEYYGKYIGDGTIKVKDIDHEKKTLTLESVENEISDAIPEWVPKNYSQAVELYNKYGSTHIEKDSKGIDTVCILIPENPSSVVKYEYEVSDSSVNEIYHNVFSDTQADYKFEIIVINDTRETPSKFDVSYKYNSYLQWVYSFSNNGSGKLTETDILSWAPDCITEFNNFEEKYGTVSIINGYVAFCEKWDNGANYGWNWTQTGNGKLTKYFGFGCNEMYIKNSTDKTEYCFNLCRPEMDGIVNMQWSYGRFNETPIEVIERNYEVSNNCSVLKEISNNIIKGDVNADGKFTVADVVMLQKWLLGVPDVTLPNWKAADLCEDGELNVFDLCMMKRELISNTDNKPILTKAELRDIILSKEEFTWSDFERYQSEDVGSGLYILKYKVDFDGEDIEVYLYITGSDLKKKPEKIYIEVRRDEEENINIYEFRKQLIDFIDSFNRQDMTMDDVFELSKKGKNLTWSDFENYQHGEDIGSGINIYEFNIADHSDRFTLVVGYSDENSILYARLKSSGSTIDITESSENDIVMFIAEHNPPA